jgi:hypothetical protein
LKQIRRHLTYANVMSSIAVFLLLGGATALAATKIGPNQLKANSVKTGKIVKEAVTNGKIKKNAVTGAKVRDGSLSVADLAAGTLTPACPTGTVLAEGVCFQSAPNAAASYENAIKTCASVGGRLPGVQELVGYTLTVAALPAAEQSGDLFSPETDFNVESNGTRKLVATTTATPFRCVEAPSP